MRVPEAGVCLLADFPAGALVGIDDIAAGTVVRFQGPFGGTAILTLEPEDALAWVRSAPEPGDPIRGHLERSADLLARAVGGWGQSMGASFSFTEPTLCEDAVAGLLLGTHAPSDTLILSARLVLSIDGRERSAWLYLMVDPKVLEVWASHAA